MKIDLPEGGNRVRRGRQTEQMPQVVARRNAILSLAAPSATEGSLTGAKASVLARAMRAGLPVLPGFVITTDGCEALAAAGANSNTELRGELYDAWKVLSDDGTRMLVVRSSSTAEDGNESSMAGMFTSLLGITDFDSFLSAVEQVIDSRKVIDLGAPERTDAPIAVLVQPQLDAAFGGIMFGVDPISGDRERISVVAVEGGPDVLVSGAADGQAYTITRRGRILNSKEIDDRILSFVETRQLARMAERAAANFGGPQDIEWGIDRDGKLHMFQSRPVTAIAAMGSGPIMGPGPVAETFPDPLSMLETDLWVTPLRAAVIEALALTGSSSKRRIERSPVVTTVLGRVAADLELFGIAPMRKSFWARIDPIPPARRMGAAWRVGRMRAALPLIASSIIEKIDERLANVPDIRELTNDQLLQVMLQARRHLTSLHGFEVLSGMLEPEEDGAATGAALALRSLALANSEGFTAEDIVANHPEVLALTPPAIQENIDLPNTTPMALSCGAPSKALGPREALRLRVRWVQELSARAAWELGTRMIPARLLRKPEQIAQMNLDEIQAMLERGNVPDDLKSRSTSVSPPLPSAFRVTEDGVPVPVQTNRKGEAARGAGGGRGMGRVHHGTEPKHGDVLVVRTLDPNLAPLLPTLGGLVAETGNVLSHLAILAREFGVPTVVGRDGALEAFPEGTVVVVDGSTGEVSEVSEA